MPTPEEFNKTGMEHYRAGRLNEAIEAYEAAVAQRPDYAACFLNLSLAYLKKNRGDDAVNAARRASDLAPQAGQARLHLANALSARGRWNEAVSEYVRACDLDKNQFVGLLLAANLLMDHGVDAKAIELWQKFLAAAPPDHPRRAEAEEQLKQAQSGETPFAKF